MIWICSLVIVFLFCVVDIVYVVYKVQIDVFKLVQLLLKDFLDILCYQDCDDISDEQLKFMMDIVGDQVCELIFIEGYFILVIKVSVQIEVGVEGKQVVCCIIISVDFGLCIEISLVDVSVIGLVVCDDQVIVVCLCEDWLLFVGQFFCQEDWSCVKNVGLEKLQQKKYVVVCIVSFEVCVDLDEYQVDLVVCYDSGLVFMLGFLQIIGMWCYLESIICNVNLFIVGEFYDVNCLLVLQWQIQNMLYFFNVIVVIDDDFEYFEQMLVKVQVIEFLIYCICVGVGYSIDIGVQVEGCYLYYNVFNKVYVFDSQLCLEQKCQYGVLLLVMLLDDKVFVNSINIFYDCIKFEGIDLCSQQVGFKCVCNSENYDIIYLFIYYCDELSQEDGSILFVNIIVMFGKYCVLVLGFVWLCCNVDDLIFLCKGNLLMLEVGFVFKGLLIDQSFLWLYGCFKQFFLVGKCDIVVLCVELGGVFIVGSVGVVLFLLLFCIGGNDLVCGYSYQSIGNEQNGIVYLIKYLVVGSLEYQCWFSENWGVVVFYDVGVVVDNWNNKIFYYGVGIGVCWCSLVGMFNLDLVYGIQKCQIWLYILLGIVFQCLGSICVVF